LSSFRAPLPPTLPHLLVGARTVGRNWTDVPAAADLHSAGLDVARSRDANQCTERATELEVRSALLIVEAS